MSSHSGPLHGVRVLDLTSVILGPFATQILAELGADVIKVEPPEGDGMRHVGPMKNPGMGPLFLHTNQGKRSIVLDLKTPDDHQTFLDLVQSADVFISNMRPSALQRLQIDYDRLKAHNPKIIYALCSGFNTQGARAGKPAYDDLMQGASGLADLLGTYSGGEPGFLPLTLSDRVTGLHAVYAITAALFHRSTHGAGQQVEIPMYEVMSQLVLADHLGGQTFEPPLDNGGYARLLTRNRKPYPTKDGYICAVIYQDKHWNAFFRAVDAPKSITEDERFKGHASRIENSDYVYGYIADVMKTRSTEEWQRVLEAADIPNVPMKTLADLMQDDELLGSGLLSYKTHPTEGTIKALGSPIHWSKSKPAAIRHAPGLGEHNAEIRQELIKTDNESMLRSL
jgi:crotonobetainyl-CoA:carnitine CoA-transferase CaiB-like acyl-CoA transferase